MRYRFPLELELTILELAAPALAIDSLHDRVDFFINISLVHRSFTTWAQERLHDQFLYTYQPRPDEHARLKTRLEAAVGGDCPLRRLYLDLTALPANILKRREPGADSVSATMYGRVYPAVSDPQQAGTDADEQPCISVAHFRQSQHDPDDGYWELCAMISSYSQTIDTLWIKPPFLDLNIKDLSPPRVLYIDDGKIDGTWGYLGSLPSSSKTVLFLRNTGLGMEEDDGDLDICHLILDNCWAISASAADLLDRCRRLETLVFVETETDDLVSTLASMPRTVRSVHVLDGYIYTDNALSDAPVVLPHLESFTFTWLPSSANSGSPTPATEVPNPDALADLQHIVESVVDAPQCTFKYLRSTKSRDEALADALAAFDL